MAGATLSHVEFLYALAFASGAAAKPATTTTVATISGC